jgi:uncharacterized membrane protein YhaH (DUF805 family)
MPRSKPFTRRTEKINVGATGRGRMTLDRRLAEHPVHSLASLALFLPGLAVSVRRLHDLDRTGWWLLIILTGIGLILLLIWFCLRGTTGPNRYGPDPLAAAPMLAT